MVPGSPGDVVPGQEAAAVRVRSGVDGGSQGALVVEAITDVCPGRGMKLGDLAVQSPVVVVDVGDEGGRCHAHDGGTASAVEFDG